MFFTVKRAANYLSIDDLTFAKLTSIDLDGTLNFRFIYKLKYTDIARLGTLTVRVSILSKNISNKLIVDNSNRGINDNSKTIDNIIKHIPYSKSIINQRKNNIIASTNSSVNSNLDINVLSLLKRGVQKENIQELKKKKIFIKKIRSFKEKNTVQPLFQLTAHVNVPDIISEMSSSISFDSRKTIHDMIQKHGIDPSDIVKLTPRTISAKESVEGLIRKSTSNERSYAPSTKLLHKYLFNDTSAQPKSLSTNIDDDETLITEFRTSINDVINIPVDMSISQKHVNTNYFVKLDLIDEETGEVVDQLTTPLDTNKYVNIYYTPSIPPIVYKTVNEYTSQASIEITQNDPGGQSVEVWKKHIYKSHVSHDSYTLINTIDLIYRQTHKLLVEIPSNSQIIYRIIPVGDNGQKSSSYSNVIVQPKTFTAITSLSLNMRSTDVGCQIEARSFPPSVEAIGIYVKDLTTYDKDFTLVGLDKKLIDDSIRGANSYIITDINVQSDHVYEYVAKLTNKNGIDTYSNSSIYQHIDFKQNKVDITINDLQIDNDRNSPNVTFNFESTILDSDLDIVNKLLEEQGIKEFFTDELFKQRNSLKNLIAHNIQRINLTTGARENFGTLTNSVFNDNELSVNNSIKPLNTLHLYRYEITTLLRAPETLFEEFVKTSTDLVTNKKYNFKPSKFLHPHTKKTGMLISGQGSKVLFPNDQFSFGNIGVFKYVDVSFGEHYPTITSAVAVKFNDEKVILNWETLGDLNRFDHFIIMKSVHGVRTVVGTVHSNFKQGKIQYIHELEYNDISAHAYIITPVYSDYTLGNETKTNLVIIE